MKHVVSNKVIYVIPARTTRTTETVAAGDYKACLHAQSCTFLRKDRSLVTKDTVLELSFQYEYMSTTSAL